MIDQAMYERFRDRQVPHQPGQERFVELMREHVILLWAAKLLKGK